MIRRDAVNDLVIEYWYEVDHHHGANVHLLFSSDGTLTYSGRTIRGRDAIAAIYADRQPGEARGMRVTRHVTTNTHVSELGDTTATVHSIVCLFAQDGVPPLTNVLPAGVLDVVDQVELADGSLTIASRVIETVFKSP